MALKLWTKFVTVNKGKKLQTNQKQRASLGDTIEVDKTFNWIKKKVKKQEDLNIPELGVHWTMPLKIYTTLWGYSDPE